MRAVPIRWGRLVTGGLMGFAGLGLLVAVLVLGQSGRKAGAATKAATGAGAPGTDGPTRAARVSANSLDIPLEVIRSLDLRTTPAACATRPRPLPPFAGTLAADHNRMAIVHPRFAGELVALGTTEGAEASGPDSEDPSADRPLRV